MMVHVKKQEHNVYIVNALLILLNVQMVHVQDHIVVHQLHALKHHHINVMIILVDLIH